MVLFLYLYSISNSSFSDSSIYITFFIFFQWDFGYFLAKHPFLRGVTMFSYPFLEGLLLLDGINRVFGLGVFMFNIHLKS